MKINEVKCISSLTIAGGILLTSTLACAQVSDFRTDVILRLTGAAYGKRQAPDVASRNDCLISSNKGGDARPSRFAWGNGNSKQTYCGFPDALSLHLNEQAVWVRRHVTVPEAPARKFYVFEMKKRLPGAALGRCLFPNAAGTEPVLVSKAGGTGPICGWTSAEIMQDKGAIWEISQAGTITSYKTNKCLMFGNSGVDIYASLFRWGPGIPNGDESHCGLPYEDVRNSGQAWFYMTDVRYLAPPDDPRGWIPEPYPDQLHTLEP